MLCGWKNQTRSKARKVQNSKHSNLMLSMIEKRALNAWNGIDKCQNVIQSLPVVPSGITIKQDLSSCNNSPVSFLTNKMLTIYI